MHITFRSANAPQIVPWGAAGRRPSPRSFSDTAYEPQRERLTPGGGRAIPTISPRSGLFGPHFEAMALGLAQAGAQVLALAARGGGSRGSGGRGAAHSSARLLSVTGGFAAEPHAIPSWRESSRFNCA